MSQQLTGDPPVVALVIPCFNEEEMLPYTIEHLIPLFTDLIWRKVINHMSRILFVDDGSRDITWSLIQKYHQEHPCINGLKLSRNVGHQKALLAGLLKAKDFADCIISIDADLQDDISLIEGFVEKYKDGYEVVYGVRRKRDTDTFFKRNTALLFYKLMRKMGVDVVNNHADYRMMSKRVVGHLEGFQEVNLFLRGIVPTIGFKSDVLYYDRSERLAGESKYPLKKMLLFAWEGITSFSITPIRLVTIIGFTMSVFSILFAGYVLVRKLTGGTVSGWSSLILSVWLIGGIQLLCVGLIGEYIGKVYIESKNRPKYFVETDLDDQVAREQIIEKPYLMQV